MPPDPSLRVAKNRRLKTRPRDIGHVAPSFEDPKRVNSLVIRPEYRISIKLGDIERLFKHRPGTKEGRMERMQVCGLFYFPLARTVMGGLISSAIFTLLALPSLTLAVEGVAAWLRRIWAASRPRRLAGDQVADAA